MLYNPLEFVCNSRFYLPFVGCTSVNMSCDSCGKMWSKEGRPRRHDQSGAPAIPSAYSILFQYSKLVVGQNIADKFLPQHIVGDINYSINNRYQ